MPCSTQPSLWLAARVPTRRDGDLEQLALARGGGWQVQGQGSSQEQAVEVDMACACAVAGPLQAKCRLERLCRTVE